MKFQSSQRKGLELLQKGPWKKQIKAIRSCDHGWPWELCSGHIPVNLGHGSEGKLRGNEEEIGVHRFVVLGEVRGGLDVSRRRGQQLRRGAGGGWHWSGEEEARLRAWKHQGEVGNRFRGSDRAELDRRRGLHGEARGSVAMEAAVLVSRMSHGPALPFIGKRGGDELVGGGG